MKKTCIQLNAKEGENCQRIPNARNVETISNAQIQFMKALCTT